MKMISPKLHGILDYLFILFLLASPTLFKLQGSVVTFTYTLAGVHFLLTILTRYPLGIIKLIPFPLHGLVELAVSIGLVGVSLWFNHAGDLTAFYLYIWLAVVVLAIFFLTDFGTAPRKKEY